MVEKYMRNGMVDRAAIAIDVKKRKLNPNEIRQLCNSRAVQDVCIGIRSEDKKAKQYWNQEYLDLLYWAVAAESFNLDYLLHLREVADFVAKKKKKKKIIVAGIIIVLVMVAGIVVFSYIQSEGSVPHGLVEKNPKRTGTSPESGQNFFYA